VKTFLSLVLVAFSSIVCAQDAAKERTIIVVDGDKAPKVKPGDILRFTQSGAVGRTEIAATVEGDAKLISTTTIKRFRDGMPLIGAVVKEFEVKAAKSGQAVVKITVTDLVGKTTKTKEYPLEIE
jgi:hypothetical protein